MNYTYPIVIPVGGSSNEEKCYSEVLGLNNNEMNKTQYTECLERENMEETQAFMTGLGFILLMFLVAWIFTR